MKWSLLELKKFYDTPILFDEYLDLKNSLIKRDSEILDVAPVKITGTLTPSKKEYLVNYKIETILTLPSSRSLEPVAVPLAIDVNEVFMTDEQFLHKDDFISAEEILLLETAVLDLKESIEDNVLLAIPIQVLSEEEKAGKPMPKGSDWEVVSEEEFNERKASEAQSTIDPRLAKLSELFSDPSDSEKEEQ